MRILQVSDTYPPDSGGLEMVVSTLAAEWAARGHESHVATLASRGRADAERVDGVSIHRLTGFTQSLSAIAGTGPHQLHPTAPDPKLVRRLQHLVDWLDPDVIHVHGWILHSVLSVRRTAPLVVTAHDYGLTCSLKTLIRQGNFDEPCSGPTLRGCLACASDFYGPVKGVPLVLGLAASQRRLADIDALIAVSEVVAATLPEELSSRVEVIAPTVQLPEHAHGRARPDGAPDRYIAFVGASGPHKGLSLLADALDQVRASAIEAPEESARGLGELGLIAVTPEPLPPELAARVDHRVGLPRQEVLAVIEHASACVVPSRWAEPFGLVPVEAMALGTPVVVSDAGALPHVVGRAGIVSARTPAAMADAIRAAMKSSESTQQRGRQRAAEFSPPLIADRVEATYRRLIESAAAEE